MLESDIDLPKSKGGGQTSPLFSASTAELLTASEICPRKAHWSLSYEAWALPVGELLSRSVNHALGAALLPQQAPGEVAASQLLDLAEHRGVDTEHPVYATIIHHAAIADLIATVLRPPNELPWRVPAGTTRWNTGCFVTPSGTHLRRIVLVSNWSDEREAAVRREWSTVGEIAEFDLPMQIAVFMLGQLRRGKRSGPWSKAFWQPRLHSLRFRKRTAGGLSPSYEPIWREDRRDIPKQQWLQAMLDDGVLKEACFHLEVDRLPPERRALIQDMAERKLSTIRTQALPDKQLTGCFWPRKCQFLPCCWGSDPQPPSEKTGFVKLASHACSFFHVGGGGVPKA